MDGTARSGWSGAVRRERGGRVFTAVAGRADTGRLVDDGTRFQAGSISKAVLAATVLRLVEQGALDLGVPIGRLLPDLPAATASLTLHRLLTHTSGLGHWRDLPEVEMADPPERAVLMRMVLARPAPHPVGTFSYSNFGYLLAASVVEAATGLDYADAAAAAVLEPAEMTSSTSGAFPIGAPDVASGHLDGAPVAVSSTPTGMPGTGDLWTTTGDLVRFSRALHGGRLLRPEHVSAMTSALVPLPAATPLADDRIVAHGYGYGTWVGTVDGAPAAVHPGDNVGYRSLLVRLLGREDDIAVLTNDEGPTLAAPLDLALGAFGSPRPR